MRFVHAVIQKYGMKTLMQTLIKGKELKYVASDTDFYTWLITFATFIKFHSSRGGKWYRLKIYNFSTFFFLSNNELWSHISLNWKVFGWWCFHSYLITTDLEPDLDLIVDLDVAARNGEALGEVDHVKLPGVFPSVLSIAALLLQWTSRTQNIFDLWPQTRFADLTQPV